MEGDRKLLITNINLHDPQMTYMPKQTCQPYFWARPKRFSLSQMRREEVRKLLAMAENVGNYGQHLFNTLHVCVHVVHD